MTLNRRVFGALQSLSPAHIGRLGRTLRKREQLTIYVYPPVVGDSYCHTQSPQIGTSTDISQVRSLSLSS